MFRISTWRLMLQMLVHVDYTPNAWFACYRWEYIVLVIFLQFQVMELVQYLVIVIVNMEYYIIIFIVRNSVFQLWIVSAEFGSSRFCRVQFILFLCMSAVHGEFDLRICSSLALWSQFRCESSTGTRYLKLVLGLEFSTRNMDWKLWSSTGTHISVDVVKICSFITAKLVCNY